MWIDKYTWRSIQQNIWIINKGTCWTVGNGESVNGWEDQWLPFQNGFKVLTQDIGSPSVLLVRDPMDREPKGWNKPLIDSMLYHFEAEQIKQIPLVE